MFQGPKGYIAQICEVHLQYGNSNKMAILHFFLVKFTLIYILFAFKVIAVDRLHESSPEITLILPLVSEMGVCTIVHEQLL